MRECEVRPSQRPSNAEQGRMFYRTLWPIESNRARVVRVSSHKVRYIINDPSSRRLKNRLIHWLTCRYIALSQRMCWERNNAFMNVCRAHANRPNSRRHNSNDPIYPLYSESTRSCCLSQTCFNATSTVRGTRSTCRPSSTWS